jgi:hypothetical protein
VEQQSEALIKYADTFLFGSDVLAIVADDNATDGLRAGLDADCYRS